MIIHLWHHMGLADEQTLHRLQIARESRENEYRAYPGVWIAPALFFSRDSRKVGDTDPVPYVRDMIAQGMAYAKKPDDMIFLTNADIGFAPDITLHLTKTCHMRRRDIPYIARPLTAEEIESGEEYPGGDGFAFTADWWKANGRLFPDMLLGRYGWDSAMRNLIRRGKGVEVKNQLFHQKHSAPWNETSYDIDLMPGNRHNRQLLLAWIEKYGGSTEDHLHPDLKYK